MTHSDRDGSSEAPKFATGGPVRGPQHIIVNTGCLSGWAPLGSDDKGRSLEYKAEIERLRSALLNAQAGYRAALHEARWLRGIVEAAALETYTPDGSERFVAKFHETLGRKREAEATISHVAQIAEEWIEFGGDVMRTNGHVLREALRRTGSTEIDQLRDQITDLNYAVDKEAAARQDAEKDASILRQQIEGWKQCCANHEEEIVTEHFDLMLRLEALADKWAKEPYKDFGNDSMSSGYDMALDRAEDDLRALIAELDTRGAFGSPPYCDDRLPEGWSCTRAEGHDGPCIAREVSPCAAHEEADRG